MKILQVSTHFNIGGIGSYILSLSAALKERGVGVIVASGGGNLERELEKYGISHKVLKMDTKFELSPKVFASALRLARIIKDENIDLIHAHSRVSQAASLLASRLTGIRHVTTCHGFFRKRFRGIFDTWGDKVIAISDAVRVHLEKDLGVKKDRIELIYNGIDPAKFSKKYSGDEIRDMKRREGLSDGPVIGTIGRLSPIKGQRFLIEAMPAVLAMEPKAQVMIVGDGDEKDDLEKLARSLKITGAVHFVPSDTDTHKFLSIMDVFVFPSVNEGLGLALLEALASGKACVASRIGGIGDIIDSGTNGILVGSGNSDAMAGAVISLLSDPASRIRMGERGRSLVAEKFSLVSMADKVIKLYEKVTGR